MAVDCAVVRLWNLNLKHDQGWIRQIKYGIAKGMGVYLTLASSLNFRSHLRRVKVVDEEQH